MTISALSGGRTMVLAGTSHAAPNPTVRRTLLNFIVITARSARGAEDLFSPGTGPPSSPAARVASGSPSDRKQ